MVFAIHHHESAMSVHVSHHPEPPSHLPSHPIPLGCPRALSLSALRHALNLHWSSILRMVIYTFQCCSLILSHPCLLPHSPKVCSLHLCLFCCLAYRAIVNRFSKFHIYTLIYSIGVSFSQLTSLCIMAQFHPPH